jgi:hypothetical protein
LHHAVCSVHTDQGSNAGGGSIPASSSKQSYLWEPCHVSKICNVLKVSQWCVERRGEPVFQYLVVFIS